MKLFTQSLTKRKGDRRAIERFLMYAVCFNLLISAVIAGPEGAEVVNGQVSFQQNGNNTVITASNKAIVNYSSFDIARPEIVEFIQPDSSASVLNRILSSNPTHIDGTLLANGRVFFVNPAGVYIGNGARINVNQLVSSALNISNTDFINGHYNFADGEGAVINSGDISAEQVYLIGKQVTNSGNISCPAGYVVMAAGDRIFLGEPGTDVVLEVQGQSLSGATKPIEPGPGILNEGEVEAAGGIIALAAAGDIYSQAISNVGSLSVSNETGETGQIKLAAAKGTVSNTGIIEASGNEGGQVTIEGARVGQFGTIHADGTIGDGGNVNLTASEVVALSSDSLTTANAGLEGNGGEVIVYSPDTALFRPEAKIEAKGGTGSGNGGFVEISGKQHVEIFGGVDTKAVNGENGILLIDPTNVTITGIDAGGSWSGGNTGTWTPSASGSVANVNTALANGDVIVTTNNSLAPNPEEDGDITVTSTVTASANANNLTLQAADDIILNAGINMSAGTGNLTLTADWDGGDVVSDGDGAILNGGGTITMGTGDLLLQAGSGIGSSGNPIETAGLTDVAAATTTGGIYINNSTSGIVNVSNVGVIVGLDAGAGDISITNTGRDITVSSAIDTDSGSVTLAGAFLDIDASINATTSINLTAGANLDLDVPGNPDNIIDAGNGNVTLDASSGDIVVANNSNIEINTSGTVNVTAQTIGAAPNALLDLDGATALEIEDKGAGDIFIREQTASTIASTTITVANAISGSISIDYFGVNTNEVDIGNGHIINNVDLSHNVNSSFTYTATSGDISIDTINTGTKEVTITAGSGAIDNDTAPNGSPNIVGGEINLTAASGGIGNTNNLEVDAATWLNADSTVDNYNINIDSISDIPIGLVDAGSGNVTLNSTGSINDATDDTTEDISGTTITLTAADEIGGGIATQTVDTRGALEVASGSLDISVTTAGDIVMTESDGTQLADVDTSSGSIGIISTTGDLTIGDIDATGTVTLQATTGSINDATDDTTEDISGTTITLTAADEIGGGIATQTVDTRGALEVASGSLNVSVTTAGDIVMTESDGTQLPDVDTSSGSIGIISTTGDLTIGDIDATGTVTLQATTGSINETGGGDAAVDISGDALTLMALDEIGGAGELDIETTVTSLEASSTTGDIVLTETDNVTLGDVQAATGNIVLQSTGGLMTHQVGKIITAGSGSLTMRQRDSIDTKDFTFSNQSNTDLTLESFNGSVTSDNAQAANAADEWQSITATAKNNIELRGTDDIKIGGDLTSNSGGVSIISDNGTVRTAGDSILDNVAITGYSNQAGSIGVGLPFDNGQKAAILISSKENLTLGTSATLSAGGVYDSSNDDRASIGFATSGPDAGNPIDVAIYVGSTVVPKVDVQSLVANIGSNGAMVIDASDTVRFGDTFKGSAFNVTHWLEVVSRESTTLQEVINGDGDFPPPRLPDASNPENIRSWFDGTYVIRGKALFAEILALINPVPLAPPQPLEPEIRGEVEGPDIEALIELLTELGIGVQPYVTNAYADSLSTDLRLYKAAEKLQELIPILEDADGTGMAGLRVSVAKFFPTLDTLTEKNIALFSRELEDRRGDGSDYDIAGKCITALTKYVNILGTEIGWPVEKSLEFVMGRYVPRLTEGDDIRIAVVQMYLQRAF